MIEVIISDGDYPMDAHPLLYESWVLAKLRAGGIPVVGFLCFQGVSSGTLEWDRDIQTLQHRFKWYPPPESKPPAFVDI